MTENSEDRSCRQVTDDVCGPEFAEIGCDWVLRRVTRKEWVRLQRRRILNRPCIISTGENNFLLI